MVTDELVKQNLGLVYKQLNRFGLRNDQEAISLAYEALFIALSTFDPSKNNRLSTYATVCIYNKLGSYIRSLNTSMNLNTISYDTPVGTEGRTLLDTLESNDTADGNLLANSGVEDIMYKVSRCLMEFKNPVHKNILQLWIDSGFERTHTSIAESIGCTQTYVSQVIKKFKYSLRRKLND